MVVRIRYTRKRHASSDSSRKAALAAGALLTPLALIAFTMTFWVVGSDLHWTGEFFLSSGLFSHWQVWLFVSGVLWMLARLLDKWSDFAERSE